MVTWKVMVVTYLKVSGGQLLKIDLFVSSLPTPFQLLNLQAHVEPNSRMCANDALDRMRNELPLEFIHRDGGQPEINKLS
jgi:hypothetical protein